MSPREYESRREREAWAEERAHDDWLSEQADVAAQAKRQMRELDKLDRDPADDAYDPDDRADNEYLLDGYRNERRL